MGGYDDELTRPLEGAIEATTSEGPTSPAVGRDEWVARHGDNRSQRGGPLGAIEDRLRRVPWWAWLTLFVAAACLVPVVSDSGYVRRVAFDIAIYMLLALGLNVVVGWGGLLDLGFVAFYGIGAYAYALLSSDHYGIHLPTIVAIPTVVVIGAVVGFLVGLPSRTADRRLPRDRDALLPAALPHRDDERRRPLRPQRHGWRERPAQRRPVQLLRARDPRLGRGRRLQRRLPLRRARVLRRRLRRCCAS